VTGMNSSTAIGVCPPPWSLWGKAVFCALALLCASSALAGQGRVRIVSPTEGSTLEAHELNYLVYEVEFSERGNHLDLYLDGKQFTKLLQWRGYRLAQPGAGTEAGLQGYYPLVRLKPGHHTLCIEVADKAHKPIGTNHCVHLWVR
jgi:hypothetical protein